MRSLIIDRLDRLGALWLFATRHHSGQWSRGYRILSQLTSLGYSPGIGLRAGRFESDEQRAIYRRLVRRYKKKV